MYRPYDHYRENCRRRRSGMTLVELLLASAILMMVVGALGAVGNAVQQGYEYSEGYGLATQHARVALDRIARNVSQATANEQFPGFLVVPTSVGTWRYPDALVVWHPSGTAANPTGLPQFNELIVYCPAAAAPSNLLEITNSADTRTVPAVTNQTQWLTEIQNIQSAGTAHVVPLTNLLRTCATSTTGPLVYRGAVRFEQRLIPGDTQWSQYQAGTLNWNQLPWVQGVYGSQTGLRQAWLRIELQLMPGATWVATNPAAARAAPFFGSAALYYEMHQ
jgi:hypothetical protein